MVSFGVELSSKQADMQIFTKTPFLIYCRKIKKKTYKKLKWTEVTFDINILELKKNWNCLAEKFKDLLDLPWQVSLKVMGEWTQTWLFVIGLNPWVLFVLVNFSWHFFSENSSAGATRVEKERLESFETQMFLFLTFKKPVRCRTVVSVDFSKANDGEIFN
jgi:hypothetical protein